MERGTRGLVQQGRVTSVRKVWREVPNGNGANGKTSCAQKAPARVAPARGTVGGDVYNP